MANHVMLNNVEHKDLKVITKRSADYGDNIRSAMTFLVGVSQCSGTLPDLL